MSSPIVVNPVFSSKVCMYVVLGLPLLVCPCCGCRNTSFDASSRLCSSRARWPVHLTFVLGWLENLCFVIEIICWAPWISQVQSTGLHSIFVRAQPCSCSLCLTQCPATLIRLSLILLETLRRWPYRSSSVMWSVRETFSTVESILV